MEPININVHVQIGVTAELLALLQPFANKVPGTERKAPAPKQEVTVAPLSTAVQTPSQEPEPAAEAQAPAEPEAPAEAPATEAPTDITEVEVRAAMDATRKRIEGEDYKSNTNSELRQKWHRKLTGWFKQQAVLLGADKPSELPTAEARASFIKICGEVQTKDDELIIVAPF